MTGMRSALAYTPRPGRLQAVRPAAAIPYLMAPALVAFLYSNPIVLAGAGAASLVAGLRAGARSATAGARSSCQLRVQVSFQTACKPATVPGTPAASAPRVDN